VARSVNAALGLPPIIAAAIFVVEVALLALLNKSSAVAEMGDRLATIDMGQKVGGLLCPFPWGTSVNI